MSGTGANKEPLTKIHPILLARQGQSQETENDPSVGRVSTPNQDRKRKMDDESSNNVGKVYENVNVVLSQSAKCGTQQNNTDPQQGGEKLTKRQRRAQNRKNVKTNQQESRAKVKYLNFIKSLNNETKRQRNRRNSKKHMPKICLCRVTADMDKSSFRVMTACNLCRDNKRLLKKEKKLARKAKLQKVHMLKVKKTENRDIEDRGVVTLEEKDEQYLTSLLQEVRASKTVEERTECVVDTEVLGGNIYNKFINNKLVSDKVVQDFKLKGNASLDNQMYHQIKFKENYRQGTPYQNMQNFRKKLPSYQMKNEILAMIEKNQVSLISGETGCGKTTQVAQFILDDYIKRRCGSTCHIVCTQPRRISAISVAQRVASERDEPVGESCGYIIRLENVPPRNTGSVMFCTLGVLLRCMIDDPYLKRVSHVIIDEIHERETLSDFLMIIIKDILPYRPNLRVVLMSATLNADMFSKYFDNCPMINIPGRTHQVKEYYLEEILEKIKFDNPSPKAALPCPWKMKGKIKPKFKAVALYNSYVRSIESKYDQKTISNLRTINFENISYDLIIAVVDYICETSEEGAILIFLPGWANISKMLVKFNQHHKYSNSREFIVIAIHSKLPSVSQKEVFDRPPRGCRKIVIGTNIVETSITIDDVVFVIDCGKAKENTYDADTNISSLETVWISKASVKQRRGRAGRVKPGTCYHLFTKYHENALDEYQVPEMLRVPLVRLCLQIKILKCGKVWEFLSKAMQPPTLAACELAVTELIQLGALDENENLTSLGYHLARLPVSPKIGKMILSGAIFSCLNPVLTVAASLESKDPFSPPMGKEDQEHQQRRVLAEDTKSDHMVLINAFNGWENAQNNYNRVNYCREYFLSGNTLQTIFGMKRQFTYLLSEIGFVHTNEPKDPAANRNSDNINLIKAIICAGLYPNVAKITYNNSGKKFNITSLEKKTQLHLHPKSVNSRVKYFESQWIIYHEKMKTSRLFLYDSTVISPYPLLFFGGSVRFHQEGGVETIEVDNGIKFHCSTKTAQIIIDLRKELDALLSKKINNPTMNLIAGHMSESHHELILKAIIDLISSEKMQAKKSLMPTGGVEDEVGTCNSNELQNSEGNENEDENEDDAKDTGVGNSGDEGSEDSLSEVGEEDDGEDDGGENDDAGEDASENIYINESESGGSITVVENDETQTGYDINTIEENYNKADEELECESSMTYDNSENISLGDTQYFQSEFDIENY